LVAGEFNLLRGWSATPTERSTNEQVLIHESASDPTESNSLAVPRSLFIMWFQDSRKPSNPSVSLRWPVVVAMSALVPYSPGSRLPRALGRELERAGEVALVKAAKIQAIDYVARRGLQAVADISDLEGRLIAQTPLAEPRLKAIADTAAGAIAAEIAGMVWS
jgi:hypothetical protein